MTNRIIVILLAIALTACSSVPRFFPSQPPSPSGAAGASSADAREDTAEKQVPEQTTESAQRRPDTTEDMRSHLAEIGRGIVLIGLIALMVWLHYRMMCPYSYC